MIKTIFAHQKDIISKVWTEEARQRSIESRQQRRKEQLGIPKVKEGDKDIYYTRIKEGDFGKNVIAVGLNKKIGMMEGIARAYEARIKVLKPGQKDEKGRTREELEKKATGLRISAQETASQVASLLGKAPRRTYKSDDLSEDQIIDMINSEELDDNYLKEIAEENGMDLEELRLLMKEMYE